MYCILTHLRSSHFYKQYLMMGGGQIKHFIEFRSILKGGLHNKIKTNLIVNKQKPPTNKG